MARLHPCRDFLVPHLLLLPYSGIRQSLPHRLDVNASVSGGVATVATPSMFTLRAISFPRGYRIDKENREPTSGLEPPICSLGAGILILGLGLDAQRP